jgi:adenylosuccinate synthase
VTGRAFAVVDLGFGDAGKGLLTDYLVRRHEAALVVRFNGGPQAGHNVVAPDGRHHTFAQFGAGTFLPGVRTFLSHKVVVHPTALLVEAEALRARGVPDPLSLLGISEGARVITPFHQAANRLRELARGAARHGSCGVGFGETVRDSIDHPNDTLFARELGHAAALKRKLRRVQERKREEVSELVATPGMQQERSYLEQDHVLDAWIEQVRTLVDRRIVLPDSTLAQWAGTRNVVFEGAQGVLLDQWHGFHPHTTWSTCTFENADALVAQTLGGHQFVRVGVLRSHMVRHGAGPLPTETTHLQGVVADHNATNDWQGAVRYGWFDAVLARYALEVTSGVDVLALTHLDLPRRLGRFHLCDGYAGAVRLEVDRQRSLVHSERRTAALQHARPLLEEVACSEDAVVARIEQMLGQKVALVCRGPRASDVVAVERGA